MNFTLKLLVTAALVVLAYGPAAAQDGSDEIRAALIETLPSAWQVVSFESSDYMPDAEVDGRDPKNPVTLTSSSKPQVHGTDIDATHQFSAEIELTEVLFEESYSEGGATFVEEVMPSGARLNVTGTYGASREAVLQLDQAGLEMLGRSLEDYDGTALLLGSPEAEEFIATLEAARVNGTLSKLLNDEGDPL